MNSSLSNTHISPIGRHQLEDWNHFMMFVTHDVSSLLSLVTWAILFTLDKKHPWHIKIGKISATFFSIATFSGFSLVYMLRDDKLDRMTPKLLNQFTLITQGFCVVGLLVNGVLDQLFPQIRKYSYWLILYHLFSIAMGLRSLVFLSRVIFQIGDVDTSPYFWAVAVELLFILTLPQLVVDSAYVVLHWRQFRLMDSGPSGRQKPYAHFLWNSHHHMSMILMVCMSSIGLMFTIAHDKYWVFTEPIQSIAVRLMIIITPFSSFLAWNWRPIWKPLKYHLFHRFDLKNV